MASAPWVFTPEKDYFDTHAVSAEPNKSFANDVLPKVSDCPAAAHPSLVEELTHIRAPRGTQCFGQRTR